MALALTRMRDAAPKIAFALVVVGAIALVVMTSRIGWIFASAAALPSRIRNRERTLRLSSLAQASIPIVLMPGLAGSSGFRISATRSAGSSTVSDSRRPSSGYVPLSRADS